MKAYCIDTSGLSNPLGNMPEDIHPTLWKAIARLVVSEKLAATAEIYKELTHIVGDIGACINDNKAAIQLEVDDTSWDGVKYLGHATRMQVAHAAVIRENQAGRKVTVGLNDISIIALARSLDLPVVSAEALRPAEAKWKSIPCICRLEGVEHLTFNELLRREKIVI